MDAYVFVPGGRRAQEDWDRVRAILEGRGRPTKALTLSDPECSTLDGHVDQVVRFLDGLSARRVILVGHSYGGLVITGAADRAPHRAAGLVYVDSAIPQSGKSLLDLFREAGVDHAKFGVPEWPPFTAPLTFDRSVLDRLPKTYIRCTRRQFLTMTAGAPAYMERHGRAGRWRYRELAADHYCMLNAAAELAEILLEPQDES